MEEVVERSGGGGGLEMQVFGFELSPVLRGGDAWRK